MSRDNKKVRCVNKDGVVKFLTAFTIKSGGARRNGFYPQPLDSSQSQQSASIADEGEQDEPQMHDETAQKDTPTKRAYKRKK